jgi:hypothetical protein
MNRTAEMFPKISTPRRVLMHCEDTGSNGPGRMGHFRCRACGHEGWYRDCSMTDIRRGIPCPNCNPTPAEQPK